MYRQFLSCNNPSCNLNFTTKTSPPLEKDYGSLLVLSSYRAPSHPCHFLILLGRGLEIRYLTYYRNMALVTMQIQGNIIAFLLLIN